LLWSFDQSILTLCMYQNCTKFNSKG